MDRLSLRIKDHSTRIFIIKDTNKLKQVIDSQKANLLVIKLVDIFKIEDIEINLAKKKVY